MRVAFCNQLTELAEKDDRVYLITTDTGFTIFDDFQKQFPDRYLNIGISESAMIGLAAGLALAGKIVFLYGIVPFVTMRCFEQIRNDLCMQNLPVKIVGVGEGLTYGGEGATHHSIEDIAVMACLPNMTVVCPGDPVETQKVVKESMTIAGPMYIRLGKSGEKVLCEKNANSIQIGKGNMLRKGEGLGIIATGNMTETALDVADLLKKKGLNPWLVSMHTVKPIDRTLIGELAGNCKLLVTIEEHSTIGGLGSIVSNVITEDKLGVELIKFAIPDQYVDVAGSREFQQDQYGLTPDKISIKLLSILST